MNKGLLLCDNNIQRRSLSYKFLAIDLHREKVIQLISKVYLPPAYVVRREGNTFTLLVCPQGGGVPVSHNALQHFPECHGAAGGLPCQVQPGGGVPWWGGTLAGGVPWPGGYPGQGGTLAGEGGTLAGEGGTLAGGYPGRGGTLARRGTLARGVPWLGGYPGRGGRYPGGVPS